MRATRIIVRMFALISWTLVGLYLVPHGVWELLGLPLSFGPSFSDPMASRIFSVGCILLPVLALLLVVGGDRVICRSKRLVTVLLVIMCTPLIHLFSLIRSFAWAGETFFAWDILLAIFELATIASIPFLLVTGYRMMSSKPNAPLPDWLEPVVIGGITVTIAGMMLMPVFYHPPSPYTCFSNLKQIGLAIAMYSDSYQGRCPMDSANPTLVGSMQLLSNMLPSATMFYCPHDQRPDAHAEADFKKLTTKNISYSYVPNLKWGDTPDSPLVLDRIYATSAGSEWPKNGNHKVQGGNVCFNDGHVAWNLRLPSALKDKNGNLVVLSP